MSQNYPTGLLDHPSGLGDINSLIRQNWREINNWCNAAYGLTAAQSTTTVTASAALFTSDNAGDIIIFDSGETGIIQSTGLTSTPATTCVVDTSQTVASVNFQIYRTAQSSYTMLARALFKGTTVFWGDGVFPQWNTAKNRFIPTTAPGYGITAGQVLFGGGSGQPLTSSADFVYNNTTKVLSVTGDVVATKGVTLGVTAQTASGATTTLDCATGNYFIVTIAAATMITLTNISVGRELHIVLIQNGTGGYAVTFDTMFKFLRTPQINTTANQQTHVVGIPRTGPLVEAYVVEDTIRRGGETAIPGDYSFSGNMTVGGTLGVASLATLRNGVNLWHDNYPEGSSKQAYLWLEGWANGQFDLNLELDFTGAGGTGYSASLISVIFSHSSGALSRVEHGQPTRFMDTVGFYGNLSLNTGVTLTLAQDPASAMQAATKQYVDAVASGVRGVKDGCRVASTANVTISGPGAAIDGVTLANGERVLLRAQTTGSQNGIYVFNGAASAMTRATDFDTSAEVVSGCLVAVSEGTSYADTLWLLTTNDPIILGTTALNFALFSTGGEINTASNLGAGAQVFKSKVGVDLQFRSFTAGVGLTKTQNADDIEYKQTDNALGVVINYVIDGGGSALTTGVKGFIEIPFSMTITGVTMMADQSGSAVVDIWKDTYANYPPTVADTITAAAKPTITGATKSQDLTLTGWTTSVAAGDILGFNVDSATTITRLTVAIRGKKNA